MPEDLGGWGLGLSEFGALQRELAKYAPATALGITMHTYWVGIAATLHAFGDDSQRWLTTYSDLVTLLLAFFVLLFSITRAGVGTGSAGDRGRGPVPRSVRPPSPVASTPATPTRRTGC